MKQAVFGESVRGASHILRGTKCQDSCRRVLLEDGTAILAAADGHGSDACPHSRTGSKIAANLFCGIVRAMYLDFRGSGTDLAAFLSGDGGGILARTVEREWKARILESHRAKGRPFPRGEDGREDTAAVFRQYGTTLLGLLITKDFVFAFQLGDGDVCLVREDRAERLIPYERTLGVATESLCMADAHLRAHAALRRIAPSAGEPVMFTLTTDGFSNSYETDEAFLDTLSDYLRTIVGHGAGAVREHLSGWLEETSREGSGDDITMMIACFLPRETSGAGEEGET